MAKKKSTVTLDCELLPLCSMFCFICNKECNLIQLILIHSLSLSLSLYRFLSLFLSKRLVGPIVVVYLSVTVSQSIFWLLAPSSSPSSLHPPYIHCYNCYFFSCLCITFHRIVVDPRDAFEKNKRPYVRRKKNKRPHHFLLVYSLPFPLDGKELGSAFLLKQVKKEHRISGLRVLIQESAPAE